METLVSCSNDLAFWTIVIVAVYKVTSLLVGLGFGYMGYRLFLTGLAKPAGDLEASYGSRTVKLSRAAPGTFFALFGATVVAVAIFQGFDVELPGAASNVLNRLPQHPPMVSE